MSGSGPPRLPETSPRVVCMKRFIYDEFSAPFLGRIIPDSRISKDDSNCAVTVHKGGTHGDGIIGIREVGVGAKVLIKETGEVYTGLTPDEWTSYNSEGVFPSGARLSFKIDRNIASRFIVAMFGPEELSAHAMQEMCTPISKCPRKVADTEPRGPSK